MILLEKESEFLGALTGDGYISLACGKYIVGFTGHPRDDFEYYAYLSNLFFELCGKKPSVGIRAGGLRMKIYSKKFCEHLTIDFGFIAGENKAYLAEVLKRILNDWQLLRQFIKGFADTDGSVFGSKKPGVDRYPAIELNTCSLVLAQQLRTALVSNGFRVTNLRSCFGKLSTAPCFKVCLYGKHNLHKWLSEIGFSNPTKLNKAKALLSVN